MANGQSKRENRPPAPDFPARADWINTERPLTMEELRGRVILLDFWTYACINCMHILPDLAKLERKYGDRLVIVGVHSAKYTGERDTENIRSAVRRYGIHHPVVNDAGMILWQRLGVNAWPTLVLIDQRNRIVGKVSGEGNYPLLDRAVSDLLHEQPGSPAELSPLPLTDEVRSERETLLRFPGKILADSEGQRLFVSDSGHNRIVVAHLTGEDILFTIGSGKEGFRNGGFEDADFSNPQGMALVDHILYICDTDNHVLRAADLETCTVQTVAGTGHQAPYGSRGGPADTTPLNSPWDVVRMEDDLYIAMAGPHQIWRYSPKSSLVEVYAGSGREDIVDGSLGTAALAQPSGITTDGHNLYFADSETSSIRKITDGKVITLAGKGLFEFGHRDGMFRNAMFQHPLGVVWDNESLWVADTYNNRLRRIDLARLVVETAAGNERDGLADGIGEQTNFDEPGGVSVAEGRVYIADTNNHAIRIFDPLPRTVTTYTLVETVAFPAEGGSLQVRLFPPEGFHINIDAPSFLDVAIVKEDHTLESTSVIRSDEIRISLPLGMENLGQILLFSGDIYLCREGDQGLCTLETVQFTRKLRPEPELTGSGVISYSIPRPGVEFTPELVS